MNQCQTCFRFNTNLQNKCCYCNSQKLEKFKPTENKSIYKINIGEIIIKNKEYKIAELIDRGGFGTVLKVKSDNKFYALKVPLIFDELFTNNQSNSEELLIKSEEYIKEEINTLNKLRIKTTLKIYYTGEATVINKNKETTFSVILMEVAETTLSNIILNESNGKTIVPLNEKENMIKNVLNSLKNIHNNKLIHRDLSSDNIFVVNRKDKINYIISDFGTTIHNTEIDFRQLSSQIVAHGAYLDPERLTNDSFRYDARSDIWSIGIIIIEILIGNFWPNVIERGILDNKDMDFEKKILKKKLKNYFDNKLLKILTKSVKRNPEKRYKNIELFEKKINKYFKNIKKRDLKEKCNLISIFMNFNIELPLKIEKIRDETFKIRYKGNNNIILDKFRNYTLTFKNKIINNIEAQGSQFYKIDFKKNNIHIIINKKYIKKKYNKFNEILTNSKGKIHMMKILKINYIRSQIGV